jgi:hypothetical protein
MEGLPLRFLVVFSSEPGSFQEWAHPVVVVVIDGKQDGANLFDVGETARKNPLICKRFDDFSHIGKRPSPVIEGINDGTFKCERAFFNHGSFFKFPIKGMEKCRFVDLGTGVCPNVVRNFHHILGGDIYAEDTSFLDTPARVVGLSHGDGEKGRVVLDDPAIDDSDEVGFTLNEGPYKNCGQGVEKNTGSNILFQMIAS